MADFCAPSEPVLHRGRLPGSKNKVTLAREQRESAAAASVAQRAIRQQEKEDAERAANGAPTRSHTSGAQKRARTDPVRAFHKYMHCSHRTIRDGYKRACRAYFNDMI